MWLFILSAFVLSSSPQHASFEAASSVVKAGWILSLGRCQPSLLGIVTCSSLLLHSQYLS